MAGELAFAGDAVGAVNASAYTITPAGLSCPDNKYLITFTGGTLTINSAPLTITANDDSKTYDGAAYSGGNGVTYAGFVGGEDESVLGGTLTYSGTSQSAVNAETPPREDPVEVWPTYQAEPTVSRLQGADRYETSVEISRAGWSYAQTVVLARGDSYADALGGVPLAFHLDAPILLTRTGRLPDPVLDEIRRLQARKVIILGGHAAVSAGVENQLAALGLEVKRIGGIDRFETAALIAVRLLEEQGKKSTGTAFIAYSADFPDALAASSYAAVQGFPILLSRTSTIPEYSRVALAELGVQNVIVVGGTAAISQPVFTRLPNQGKSERVAGRDRYATGTALAHRFLPAAATHLYIANGLNFPDAITGAVLAAKKNSAILLVNGSLGEPNPTVQAFIMDRGINSVTIFGGPGAVSSDITRWFTLNIP